MIHQQRSSPPGNRAARIPQPFRDGPLTFQVLADVPPDPPGDTAFVLVHGIGMSHRYLSRLHDLLAEHGPTYSIDMPGHGGLPKPGIDVDVPTMARGLARTIASLDAGPVVLVGQSMGTQWTTETALQAPELVDRLVLIGPVVDSKRRTVFAQMAALARDGLGESPRINAIVVTDYLRCGVPWYLAQLRHMIRYQIEKHVERLTMPLLIMRGGRDPIAKREWCERLRDRAPAATFTEIPGHHHIVQESAPRAVASAIQSFVAAHPGSQSDHAIEDDRTP